MACWPSGRERLEGAPCSTPSRCCPASSAHRSPLASGRHAAPGASKSRRSSSARGASRRFLNESAQALRPRACAVVKSRNGARTGFFSFSKRSPSSRSHNLCVLMRCTGSPRPAGASVDSKCRNFASKAGALSASEKLNGAPSGPRAHSGLARPKEALRSGALAPRACARGECGSRRARQSLPRRRPGGSQRRTCRPT